MLEIWIAIFIILVIVEMTTVNLVSIWFAVGALITAFLTFLTDNVMVQVACFVLSSAITLLLTKPFVRSFQTKKVEATNLDRVIGKVGIVTEKITKLEPGEVKVDGKRWSAVASKAIPVGKDVEILSIDGVKLHVKEVKEEE